MVFTGFSDNGIFNIVVHGHHHDENTRKLGWTYQMLKDKSDAIDVYWYVTIPTDNPKKVQTDMLKDFIDQTGRLPKMNK